jgi:large subunit ribosomal protein L25
MTMTAQPRAKAGKEIARKVRNSGLIPGIIYGAGKADTMISIDPREVVRGLNRQGFYATVVDLTVGDTHERVITREVQFHPVNDNPVHIDFMRVTDATRVRVNIPVKLVNAEKCAGVRLGGVLNIVRHNVEVLAPAANIPEVFEVDILTYKIGTAVRSSAITLPAGVNFTITDRDFTLATIVPPRGMTVAEQEEADAAAAAASA